MKPKKLAKILAAGALLAALLYFIPLLTIAYLLLGLIDVSRHGRLNPRLLKNYFAGKGILTWLLAPLNLLFDLTCFRRHYRLYLDDFPEAERAEIQDVLDTFEAKKEEITSKLRAQMKGRKRGMLFYKWYGRDADTSVPEFVCDHVYVKTIGVSVFNSRAKTSTHFGPLRLTVRLLYNLTPRTSERIFIEVNDEKHYWHDDPLFIFDDTIQHRSVNDADGERFCVFLDVLRPSRFTRFHNGCMRPFGRLLFGVNRVFYKRWDMLAQMK